MLLAMVMVLDLLQSFELERGEGRGESPTSQNRGNPTFTT